jgi:hypothetical protein
MQDDTRPNPLLLLGTFHMANPGRDVFNARVDDVRAPARQAELRAVVDGLKRFTPSRVAVELAPEAEEAFNQDYAAYRAGAFELTANERHQIGFRVAAELGHERIHAIDWNEADGDLGEALEYAREHQPAIYDEVMAWGAAMVEGIQARLAGGSIGDALRWVNDPETLRRDHRVYLSLARIGDGARYVGNEWVKGWYERNLKIYANLARITAPGERILVIYGSGHIPLLAQFARDSGLYALGPVERYLGA